MVSLEKCNSVQLLIHLSSPEFRDHKHVFVHTMRFSNWIIHHRHTNSTNSIYQLLQKADFTHLRTDLLIEYIVLLFLSHNRIMIALSSVVCVRFYFLLLGFKLLPLSISITSLSVFLFLSRDHFHLPSQSFRLIYVNWFQSTNNNNEKFFLHTKWTKEWREKNLMIWH